MDSFEEGNVVIVSTSQAGTLIQIVKNDVWVLLTNRDIWTGPLHGIRYPQDQADLDAAPLNVERLEEKRTIRPKD